MLAVRNPEDYCPICGVRYPGNDERRHRCEERVLAAIDRAHRGARLEAGIVQGHNRRERLKDGFSLVEACE